MMSPFLLKSFVFATTSATLLNVFYVNLIKKDGKTLFSQKNVNNETIFNSLQSKIPAKISEPLENNPTLENTLNTISQQEDLNSKEIEKEEINVTKASLKQKENEITVAQTSITEKETELETWKETIETPKAVIQEKTTELSDCKTDSSFEELTQVKSNLITLQSYIADLTQKKQLIKKAKKVSTQEKTRELLDCKTDNSFKELAKAKSNLVTLQTYKDNLIRKKQKIAAAREEYISIIYYIINWIKNKQGLAYMWLGHNILQKDANADRQGNEIYGSSIDSIYKEFDRIVIRLKDSTEHAISIPFRYLKDGNPTPSTSQDSNNSVYLTKDGGLSLYTDKWDNDSSTFYLTWKGFSVIIPVEDKERRLTFIAAYDEPSKHLIAKGKELEKARYKIISALFEYSNVIKKIDPNVYFYGMKETNPNDNTQVKWYFEDGDEVITPKADVFTKASYFWHRSRY